jgi:hypothetical protein
MFREVNAFSVFNFCERPTSNLNLWNFYYNNLVIAKNYHFKIVTNSVRVEADDFQWADINISMRFHLPAKKRTAATPMSRHDHQS